jgi:hypothetical protein
MIIAYGFSGFRGCSHHSVSRWHRQILIPSVFPSDSFVDDAGNVSFSGTFMHAARIAGKVTVTAFSPKTTLPTVEDSGTAQLVGGAAAVLKFSPKEFPVFFKILIRRISGDPFLGVGVLGTSAAALLFATPPAAAAAVLAAAQSAVTCASTGTTPCVTGTNSSSGIGAIGASNTGTGVRGTSNTNNGVKGTSKSGVGVFGQSTSGPAGVAGISSAEGVVGAGNSIGVFGFTPGNGVGLFGTAQTGTGVESGSISGVGLSAISTNGAGLDAFSESGTAVFATSDNVTDRRAALFAFGHVALQGMAPSEGFPLRLTDTDGNVVFAVDGAGNVQAAGAVTSRARIAAGTTITAFSPKTTLPTVEDSGTAQLAGGSAVVRLDPTFAAAIDARSGYVSRLLDAQWRHAPALRCNNDSQRLHRA